MSKKLMPVVSFFSLISFAIIGYCILQLEPKEIPILLFWVFLGSLFESLPIYYAKNRAVSVTFAIFIASQLSHGAYFTTIVAALAAILVYIKNDDGTYKHLFNLPLHISLINLTNYTISIFIAGLTYQYLEDTWSLLSVGPTMTALLPLIQLVSYIIMVFFLNSTIMSLYASLLSGSPFMKLWIRGTLWALPNFLAIAPFGFFIYRMYQFPSGLIYVLMLLGPLLLARYSFKLYLDSKEQYYKIIKTLTAAIEAKDEYTEGHSKRVEHYVELIARSLRFSEGRIEALKVAALLHDIGKIGIEDSILRKPNELTAWEWERIRQHPTIGLRILDEVSFPHDVKDAILHHHEKFGGGGYPDNLIGTNISIDACILSAADAYDAMTSNRPYRNALPKETAIGVFEREKGKQFHPKVAEILISILRKEDAESLDAIPDENLQDGEAGSSKATSKVAEIPEQYNCNG